MFLWKCVLSVGSFIFEDHHFAIFEYCFGYFIIRSFPLLLWFYSKLEIGFDSGCTCFFGSGRVRLCVCQYRYLSSEFQKQSFLYVLVYFRTYYISNKCRWLLVCSEEGFEGYFISISCKKLNLTIKCLNSIPWWGQFYIISQNIPFMQYKNLIYPK